MPITSDQAIAIAKKIATQEGWMWFEPIEIDKIPRKKLPARFPGAFDVWSIRTNIEMKGCNVSMLVDAEDGTIRVKGYGPR